MEAPSKTFTVFILCKIRLQFHGVPTMSENVTGTATLSQVATPHTINRKLTKIVQETSHRYHIRSRKISKKTKKGLGYLVKRKCEATFPLPSSNNVLDDSSSSDPNSLSPIIHLPLNTPSSDNFNIGAVSQTITPDYTHLLPSIPNNQSLYSRLNNTTEALPSASYDLPNYVNIETQHIEPSTTKTLKPVPRHKRDSHINAEVRRRNKIQTGFDTLKQLVPALKSTTTTVHQKESKAAMLFTAAEYCRQLKLEDLALQNDTAELKREIEELNREIEQYQRNLPEGGVNVDKPQCHLVKMCDSYIQYQTSLHWKFSIFSILVRPLFDSYNQMVSTTSYSEFYHTIKIWTDKHLSLTNLRPRILNLLRSISINTSIMTTPERFQQEALELFH